MLAAYCDVHMVGNTANFENMHYDSTNFVFESKIRFNGDPRYIVLIRSVVGNSTNFENMNYDSTNLRQQQFK